VIECNKKYTIIYKIDQHTTEEESSHDRIETPIPLNKIIILYYCCCWTHYFGYEEKTLIM